MKLNNDNILVPNSEFDRRNELSNLFINSIKLDREDCDILKSCITEEHESIGLIGCILEETTSINKARLLIASLNRSNIELAKRADLLLNLSEDGVEELIDKLSERYLTETEDITIYEDKIYTILFGILSNR